MLRAGEMVRAGGGRLMKIADISNYVAECVWFDSRGAIHVREFDVDILDPFWLATGPRSLWPEVNDMPDDVAAAADEAAAQRRKEKARKPRVSRKIKRGGGCARH
jgi:uncharacterized protein YodC (DUF2158 family)